MKYIEELIKRYPALAGSEGTLNAAADMLIGVFEHGGKLLLCGNGGSAADCDHIAGELCKGFLSRRPLAEEERGIMKKACPEIADSLLDSLQQGLPAISLPSAAPLMTAVANDCAPDNVFAQQVMALGNIGDMLLCISTSGNAANVCAAAQVARARGLFVLALTGESGGKLASCADICVKAPETETYKVQELHLPVYHAICAEAESHFFA
ncbi:MAG: SIS domain-containing protein [Clostridia bacterium]|nr:SIS domain-containing protein [Clostridia bacterium]